MGSQRVEHSWAAFTSLHISIPGITYKYGQYDGPQYKGIISSIYVNEYLIYAKPSDNTLILVGKHRKNKQGNA